MNCHLARIAGLLFLFCIIFSLPSSSHIVHLSDLQTMAKRADMVVHGYVGEKRVVNDELGRIITLTDVEVIDGLYGAKTGEIVTIYQVGGEKDGMVMPLLGGQVYHLNQEVILFGLVLGDTYVSYGAGQGKLDITLTDGQENVVEDLGDISAVDRKSGGRKLYRPAPLSFDNKDMLKDEIRLMLKQRS